MKTLKPRPGMRDMRAWAKVELAKDIERPKGEGEFITRFVVPLTLAPLLNAYKEMPAWKRQQIKSECLKYMALQIGRRKEPVSKRPRILAIRFSSQEPDRDSAFTKIPIDRLTPRNLGLGYIRDDRPSDLDLIYWWEYAPPTFGFCHFEIWTGKTDEH